MERIHRPILVDTICEFLRPEGAVIVDGTFGEGGHTEAFLERGAKRVIAIDRDKATLDRYRAEGKFRSDPRLTLVHNRFSKLAELCDGAPIDGCLLDLGVSTRQLLTPERGFSFAQPGPVDMRMNPDDDESLAEKLSQFTEATLTDALRETTDLQGAPGVARRVLRAFREGKLQTTGDLAHFVAPGQHAQPGRAHPATAAFLALRMIVNDELGEADRGIVAALETLRVGGRLAVLTFHSTEDRLVKRLFARAAGRCVCERQPCGCAPMTAAHLLTKKPLEAGEEELRANPRARSAKLRCVEKAEPRPYP